MNDSDDFKQTLLDILDAQGNPAAVNSADCVIWNTDHNNCEGCQWELGCCKYVSARLIALGVSIGDPYSPSVGTIATILNSKSINEVEVAREGGE